LSYWIFIFNKRITDKSLPVGIGGFQVQLPVPEPVLGCFQPYPEKEKILQVFVLQDLLFCCRLSAPNLAERTRFELVVPVAQHVGLANRWFQPLTHLSDSVDACR
jgi:hypothetical protein